MEKMQDYSCYCTAEQTQRAYKLGAPIEYSQFAYPSEWENNMCKVKDEYGHYSIALRVPTTQQMIGWLREKGILFEFIDLSDGLCDFNITRKSDDVLIYSNEYSNTITQAELEAIDAALDYILTHDS